MRNAGDDQAEVSIFALLVTIARWIGAFAVPPICSIAVFFIVITVWNWGPGRMIDDDPRNLQALGVFVSNLLAGYVLPSVVSRIAPRGKFISAVVMSTVSCTLQGVGVLLNLGNWSLNLSSVGHVLGAVVGTIHVYKCQE